jgi:hypothetical protein
VATLEAAPDQSDGYQPLRAAAEALGLVAYLTLVTGRPPERALVSEVLRQRLDGEMPRPAELRRAS